jgi:hypothetical protein
MGLLNWLFSSDSGHDAGELKVADEDEVIPGLNLKQVLEAHTAWKGRLQRVLDGTSNETLAVADVSQAGKCELGRWIDGEGKQLYGKMEEFDKLQKAHSLFHLTAGEVLVEYQDGNVDHAHELLKSKFQTASNKNQLELVRLFAASKNVKV